MVLKHMKNNKAPSGNGVMADLRAGRKSVLKNNQKLFNSIVYEGTTPEARNRGVVLLFFKEGDNILLSLIGNSTLYKKDLKVKARQSNRFKDIRD
ncbi:hypothetical protein EVAR_13001_1 [Eumeta japonica]|uniref:Uncharacterized protein n=1 Tax=Eumeta variegata TaxID=151549 RepID=A0A4C1TX22_EUMVA|nr:hypothetical protein EVAR_13001_1 [Eumeta japonica]